MGSLVVSHAQQAWTGFVFLALASSALYSAGMILNDVYDIKIDAEQRPHRPLPSGRISTRFASGLGCFLLGFGVVIAAVCGFQESAAGVPPWRSGLIALLLAVSVVLYDATFKKTLLGPLFMGSCRMLNVLLGMSLAALAGGASFSLLNFSPFHWLIALGIGVYIVGVTWFARSEAEMSARAQLGFGLAVMICGVVLLGLAPRWAGDDTAFYLDPQVSWPGLLCLLTVVLLRRCVLAIADPQPRRVQAAVKLSILSLVLLDAAVAMLVSPWYCALAVLALLIPTLFLGRWVYST